MCCPGPVRHRGIALPARTSGSPATADGNPNRPSQAHAAVNVTVQARFPHVSPVQSHVTHTAALPGRISGTAHRPITDRWAPSIAATPPGRRRRPFSVAIWFGSAREGAARSRGRYREVTEPTKTAGGRERGGRSVAATRGQTTTTNGANETRSVPSRVVPPVELPENVDELAADAAATLGWRGLVLPPLTMFGRRVYVV